MQATSTTWVFVTIFGVFITQAVLIGKSIYDQFNTRREGKRAARLERLGKQLSNLYGPLFARYEIGERHWFAFLEKYSKDPMLEVEFKRFFPEDRDFAAPDATALEAYRSWMKTIFMPTNTAMEKVM